MALKKTKDKASSYYELGELLLSWRKERFRSALALSKETKFSFSYYSYVDFEKGALLPSIEQLLELARYFGKDLKQAVLIWAKAQMPHQDLKSVFDTQSELVMGVDQVAQAKVNAEETETLPPTLENTWVFNDADRSLLSKYPTLWELCLKLALRYPRFVKPEELGFSSKDSFTDFCELNLNSWLQQGRITLNEMGLSLSLPHIHLPKSDGWNDVRNANVQRAAAALIENLNPVVLREKQAYRGLLNRNLSAKLMNKWVKKLEKLEEEILAESYSSNDSERLKTCSLLILFGERRLKVSHD